MEKLIEAQILFLNSQSLINHCQWGFDDYLVEFYLGENGWIAERVPVGVEE